MAGSCQPRGMGGTELRLHIDTRAVLVAGIAAGAGYALYRFLAQAHPFRPQSAADAQPTASPAGEDAYQRAQQLQLHYASRLLPAAGSASAQPALLEVGTRRAP